MLGSKVAMLKVFSNYIATVSIHFNDLSRNTTYYRIFSFVLYKILSLF